MLHIKSFTFGPFEENTYVLYDNTGEGIVIDPGCYQDEENQQLEQFVVENKLIITKIVNTHCHIDHVLGNQFAKTRFKAPLAIPEGEQEVFRAVATYAPVYGFNGYREAEIDEYLKSEEPLKFGTISMETLLVPGHSPGHLAFYHRESKTCIGGDVLFNGSIGRTDLPGGDHQTLINSIQQKMFALPDDVIIYCGHGPETTIGHEKKTNPFCALT